LYDFDGNQAVDINEISIMVIAICKGWARFTGSKIPNKKVLEAYAELIFNAAESVPDGKLNISE